MTLLPAMHSCLAGAHGHPGMAHWPGCTRGRTLLFPSAARKQAAPGPVARRRSKIAAAAGRRWPPSSSQGEQAAAVRAEAAR